MVRPPSWASTWSCATLRAYPTPKTCSSRHQKSVNRTGQVCHRRSSAIADRPPSPIVRHHRSSAITDRRGADGSRCGTARRRSARQLHRLVGQAATRGPLQMAAELVGDENIDVETVLVDDGVAVENS